MVLAHPHQPLWNRSRCRQWPLSRPRNRRWPTAPPGQSIPGSAAKVFPSLKVDADGVHTTMSFQLSSHKFIDVVWCRWGCHSQCGGAADSDVWKYTSTKVHQSTHAGFLFWLIWVYNFDSLSAELPGFASEADESQQSGAKRSIEESKSVPWLDQNVKIRSYGTTLMSLCQKWFKLLQLPKKRVRSSKCEGYLCKQRVTYNLQQSTSPLLGVKLDFKDLLLHC